MGGSGRRMRVDLSAQVGGVCAAEKDVTPGSPRNAHKGLSYGRERCRGMCGSLGKGVIGTPTRGYPTGGKGVTGTPTRGYPATGIDPFTRCCPARGRAAVYVGGGREGDRVAGAAGNQWNYSCNASMLERISAADLSSPARSSSVSSISMICSTPLRPSLTGTPKQMSFRPYSPSR